MQLSMAVRESDSEPERPGTPTTFLAGSASRALAEPIRRALGVSFGACTTERFPDGEVMVQLDESVRGHEVVLLQGTSYPVNDHLLELLALTDACRPAAARHVVAVVPYFGYARSDRRDGRRAPITARLVATMLEAAGVDHLITLDAHTPALEGFFSIPMDNLSAVPVLAAAATHGVLVPGALTRLTAARVKALYVTDSIPFSPAGDMAVTVVSVAPIIATAIARVLDGASMRDLT